MIPTGAGQPLAPGRRLLASAILAGAVVFGMVLGLYSQNAVWEGWLLDRLFQIRAILWPAGPDPDPPVVVIGLDERSLNSGLLATTPRVFMTPVLAQAGQAAFDAGATALGFDFVFAFNSDTFTDPMTGETPLRGFDRPFLAFLYKNRGKVFVARTSTGVPHQLVSGAAGPGGVRFAEVTPDGDGVVREHAPEMPLSNSPHIIDALLSSAAGNVPGRYVTLPDYRPASSVPYLSLIDVLEMNETAGGQEALKRFFGGRVVLVGSTLPNEDEHLYSGRFLPLLSQDLAMTGKRGRPPVRFAAAGVFVLADIIGAPLSGRIAVEPPYGTRFIAAFVFAAMGGLAGLWLPLRVLPLVTLAGVMLGLGAGLAGLEFGLLIAPATAPVGFVAALVVASLGKVGLLQRRERSLVRLFGHYLSPEVIKEMASSEQLPDLGGDTRHVVVAFIDIAGFTRISESLSDKDVVRLVNTCFDEIGKTIARHGGYIDKYVGDAVMAVWNAPNRIANPEQAAVAAAEDIIALIGPLRTVTGQRDLDLRIALNAGPVLVGDIGGEQRRSFTVMGTTVNTASRIEGVAKDHAVRVAMSQSVADGLPAAMPVKKLWSGQLRGLRAETTVYALEDPKTIIQPAASDSGPGQT